MNKTIRISKRAAFRRVTDRFKTLDFKSDESVQNQDTASIGYNFDFTSGALRDSWGVNAHASVPDRAARCWVYKYYDQQKGASAERIIYAGHDNIIYDADGTALSNTPFKSLPNALNYRLYSKDVLLISSPDDKMRVYDGTVMTVVEDSPYIQSMALHYERLFVTSPKEPSKLFFSEDLDPTNWREDLSAGGFIEMPGERGKLNTVVSFLNYLYVFRDYGITRISAYGDQSEFAVSDLFVTAGKIYPDSVALCGKVIMFFSSDGLYRFDGLDCVKVLPRITQRLSGMDCAAEYFDGKYFLACRGDFDDGRKVGAEKGEHVNNVLLVYDIPSGEYQLARGLDITSLKSLKLSGGDILAACENGLGAAVVKSGMRRTEPLERMWRIPLSDFGCADMTKLVYDVYIDTDTDITLDVITDTAQREFPVIGGGVRRVRINMSGRKIGMEIHCAKTNCRISRPTIMYTRY